MSDSRLQIRRVEAQYLVPSDQPYPGHVKDRLDTEFKRNLSLVLSSAFSSWFSETDSSLWFVRKLELDFAVNAAANGQHVTKTFTKQFGRVLGEALQEGSDPTNIIRFASAADYLAHFLADLVSGNAWGCWYYESFLGLRLLPTSAVLRTAVCDRPEIGKAAFFKLSSQEMGSVLHALNQQDSRLILEAMTVGARNNERSDVREMASSVSHLVDSHSLLAWERWTRALYLFLSLSRQHDKSSCQSTDALMELLGSSSRQISEVADDLTKRTSKSQSKDRCTERHSEFGGAFLLLSLIDELPLTEALVNWRHADEAAAISIVRFLILMKCAGRNVARRIFAEPLMHDLMLLPPAMSEEDINQWQKSISESDVHSFLRALLRWQRSQARVTDRTYLLVRFTLNDSPMFVLIDGARAHWIHIQNSLEAPLEGGPLNESLRQLENKDGVLICDPVLLPSVKSVFPELSVVDINQQSSHKIVATREKLEDDLDYLESPGSLELSLTLDTALRLVAQNVLRDFAYRLPGFADSNFPYLSRNFLDFPATVDEETNRFVVRMGHPPLRLVLGITGMTRQTYRLSWLNPRPLTLFEEA